MALLHFIQSHNTAYKPDLGKVVVFTPTAPVLQLWYFAALVH